MKTEDLSKVKKAKSGVDEKDLAILKEAGVSESELASVFEAASREEETSTADLPTFSEILTALEEEGCHDIAVRLHEALVEK
jgi:hypothetical protein